MPLCAEHQPDGAHVEHLLSVGSGSRSLQPRVNEFGEKEVEEPRDPSSEEGKWAPNNISILSNPALGAQSPLPLPTILSYQWPVRSDTQQHSGAKQAASIPRNFLQLLWVQSLCHPLQDAFPVILPPHPLALSLSDS